MSSVEEILDSLLEGGPKGIARFEASLDPVWIAHALEATGKASARRRKFPAEQALWLVLGMALFADRSIKDVVDHLDLVLPGVDSLAPSAIPKARYRLGSEPLEWLFRKVASVWSSTAGWTDYKGRSLYAVDGTSVRVQDSDENLEAFGKPGGRSGSNDAGYPQVRMACLMNLRNRLLCDAAFGPFDVGEHSLAAQLWDSVPSGSIVLLDRGFMSYPVYSSLVNAGKDLELLVRLKSNTKVKPIELLNDGSALVELEASREVRREHPHLPRSIQGRLIEYRYDGGDLVRLFCTLLDPQEYPAQELVELYHERWEIELGYDEVKTHMLERKECLRSKLPDGVHQEIWGLLLTYNLVRREMLLAAEQHELPPQRISFRSSLMWIRNFWTTAWMTSPGALPKHLGQLRSTLDVLILPVRRSERRYPRHVKIKMSGYARNRGERQEKPVKKEPK